VANAGYGIRLTERSPGPSLPQPAGEGVVVNGLSGSQDSLRRQPAGPHRRLLPRTA